MNLLSTFQLAYPTAPPSSMYNSNAIYGAHSFLPSNPQSFYYPPLVQYLILWNKIFKNVSFKLFILIVKRYQKYLKKQNEERKMKLRVIVTNCSHNYCMLSKSQRSEVSGLLLLFIHITHLHNHQITSIRRRQQHA